MAKIEVRKTYAYLHQIRDEGQGRYGDGRGGLGLSLLVRKTQTVSGRNSKTWSAEAPHRQNQAGIHHYGIWFMATVVTLADARIKALDNARLSLPGRRISSNHLPDHPDRRTRPST